MMARNNLTGGGVLMETYQELLCSPSLAGELQQQSIYLALVNVILSLTAILGNFLILVALRKESSLHPPSKLLYRCLATTDILVGFVSQPLHAIYWISIANEHWNCLLLGLRYKQIVTLKHTNIILAALWVSSSIAALCYISDYRITFWFGYIGILSCLLISMVSYTMIFRTLIHHQAQVQVQVQLQSSQPNSLNLSQYRKAVYNALWVQLAFVVCYVPFTIVEIVFANASKRTFLSHLLVIRGIAATLVYFNSTLNPFLYCWKINEVRQAVKLTIRQVLCYPWR